MIDLRSDTVTKPTEKMRETIKKAEVGDDVYGEDPSINSLENSAAKKFGKESSLFVPSGTMGNQIAINVHTEPGNEVILDKESHIVNYEMSAMSEISGVMPKTIETNKPYLPIKEVKKNIKPNKYYLSETDLICIENTNNAKGGVIYPKEKINELVELAKKNNLPIHLDGARVLNAAIETGKDVKELTNGLDSIMFCLSKGLGAPVGSMLLGTKEFIKKAREVRKTLGGGMRQAGFLAAAGEYAIKNHLNRLKKDHKNAEILAKNLSNINEIKVTLPETNIVLFQIKNKEINTDKFIEKLEKKEVLISTIGDDQKFRAVTHLGINRKDIKEASDKIKSVIKKMK